MRKEEIKAMKCDLPFYCQKIVNVMLSQFPAMPNIVHYQIDIDMRNAGTKYLWTGYVTDKEGGRYFIYSDGQVNYEAPEDKLSAMAATTTDEEQHS